MGSPVKLENHAAAVALNYFAYNFIWHLVGMLPRRFTNPSSAVRIESSSAVQILTRRALRPEAAVGTSEQGERFMVASGELIRSMNYVDDIAATLRRIVSSIPSMSEEERKRLAEYLRGANASISEVMAQLEPGRR